MTLPEAIKRAVRASGLKPYTWAQEVAGIPKSTFRDVMRNGTTSGPVLAKLQKAGVRIADKKLIESLDPAA